MKDFSQDSKPDMGYAMLLRPGNKAQFKGGLIVLIARDICQEAFLPLQSHFKSLLCNITEVLVVTFHCRDKRHFSNPESMVAANHLPQRGLWFYLLLIDCRLLWV